MSEWKECTIGDIGTIVGGATPLTTDSRNYDNGNIPWITPKDLSDYHERYISRGERNITETGLKSCATQMLPKNTVLFSSRAPIGYVAIASNEVCTNQGFKSVVPNKDVDYLFLYYLLKYNKEMIEGMGSGTTFKEVSKKTMEQIKVRVPKDISVQRKIAGILDSLDSKIELNNQINRNLAEQTKALYTKLFVNEKKGRIGVFGDLVNVRYGKDHKKLSDGNVPVYGSGGIMRYADQYLYDKESVLIPRKGTLNNVIYVNEPFWSVDTMFYTEMKCENIAKYVYLFLSEKNLESLNAGSAVPSMTTDILNAMPILIPDSKSLASFEAFAAPIYTKIAENNKENKKLAMLRDALLPKFMSGEIDAA